MVPRTEIQAVDWDASLEELQQKFVESGNSKIVVYKEDIDHIEGYIHSSELFRSPKKWQDHIRTMPFVPETMQAQKLMKIFLQQKKTLGVVVDEFGGTSGLVSLEDIVEEIFGDIEDEHDEYMTIGGLILHEYQSFPKLNEVVKFDKYEFKIIKSTSRKIELVQLHIL